MSGLFDYHALVERLRLPADRLARLEACVRRQYGSDEMMFELRMVRTLRAVEERATTLDAAIEEFGRNPMAAFADTAEPPGPHGLEQD